MAKIYSNVNVPWHTHLYRAGIALFAVGDKPWHTHVYRAWRSWRGDWKYAPRASRKIPAEKIVVALDVPVSGLPDLTQTDGMMKFIREAVLAARKDARKKEFAAGKGPVWSWTETMEFNAGNACLASLGDGWGHPESDRIWSDGSRAEIEMPANRGGRATVLRFSFEPFIPPGLAAQPVRVLVDGEPKAAFDVSGAGWFTVCIPHEGGGERPRRIHLLFPSATSPAAAGISIDSRELAVSLKAIRAEII